MTGGHLPTLLVDLLGNGLPGLRRESGSLQEIQEHLTVHWTQQNPAACLAYVLENGDSALEIANVEHGQLQVNVSIVTYTVCQGFPAHLTVSVFLTSTHSVVENAVRYRFPGVVL
jgi:hypothetical protein